MTESNVMTALDSVRPDARPLDIWTAGVGLGLRTLRREPVLGLKRLVLPVGYWRGAEFAYVWRQLSVAPGSRVLDVGSPKDLAAMLAHHRRCEVVATDILPEAIDLSRRFARAQGLEGTGPGRVQSEVQDGRSLPYADASFDAAYTVSVLEHIPDRGDSQAIRELTRVVRPGGLIVVTVPYAAEYRETFIDGPVYERAQRGSEPVFFERHYDERTLADRLLHAADADVTDLRLWGETGLRMESVLERLGPLRLPLSPIEGVLSSLLLREVPPGGRGHAMAAFFTLRR